MDFTVMGRIGLLALSGLFVMAPLSAARAVEVIDGGVLSAPAETEVDTAVIDWAGDEGGVADDGAVVSDDAPAEGETVTIGDDGEFAVLDTGELTPVELPDDLSFAINQNKDVSLAGQAPVAEAAQNSAAVTSDGDDGAQTCIVPPRQRGRPLCE